MELHSELNNRSLLRQVVHKLPFEYRMSWSAFEQTQHQVNLATLEQWLKAVARTANKIPQRKTTDNSENKGRSERRVARVAAHDVTNKSKSAVPSSSNKPDQMMSKCSACSDVNHKVNSCQKFLNQNTNQRWSHVINKRLCRTCLLPHHTKDCKNKKSCGIEGCDKFHHQLLHTSRKPTEGTPTSTDSKSEDPIQEVETTNHHLNSQEVPRSILYRILPVTLIGQNKEINTFAFMDEGSSTTLLERETADELELTGPETDLCIKWTSDVSRIEKGSKRVHLHISGVDSNHRYSLSNIRTIDSLNLPTQRVDDNSLNHSHLKGLPIAKFSSGKPTILIGMDNYKLCVPLKIKEGHDGQPIATKTRLGWLLAGTLKPECSVRVNVHESDERDEELHDLVKEFFTIESMGVTPGIAAIESDDNIRALQILETTTKLNGDRYETGLIWKYPEINLPESRKMAEKRMLCLEKKLMNDDFLRDNVTQQITEYVKKGYARKLTKEEAGVMTPQTWYLPVFTVRNPNKPNKVRLVWDAAAKSHGVALNDVLLKGPDMLNPLQGILMRFREKPIAVGGDLEQMFHKVRIIPQDQNSQRFLWRSDTQQQPDVYVMEVMTFGASCSPTCAQFVLHKNSNRFIEEFPRAVVAIQQNHYVDDWLDSFGTVEEAKAVAKDVKYIHEAGGFSIHNWVSNSDEILAEMRQDGTIQKNLSSFNHMPTERVLGMHWRTTDDKFVFVINRNRLNMEIIEGDEVPTKRQVLSTVMSTFDPLGLLGSYIIYAKVLLQEIWRSGTNWDDPIKEHQYQKWKLWTQQFKSIESLEIPRCFSGLWSETDTIYEIHIFVDASEAAYAAAAYICSIKNDIRECSLIASKTRVAPNKPTSIPRLELMSAVLGARLLKTVEQSHSINFSKKFMWTDSRTVLAWLHSDARKYRQFVALRIAEILDATKPSDWRWVPTQSNVADEATKWSANQKFTDNSRWYNGPTFLKRPQDEWPKIEKVESEPSEEEMRPIFAHSVELLPDLVTPNADNFSTWERLRRITMAIPRRVRELIARHRRIKIDAMNSFSSDDFKQAETKLFKKAQQTAYADEIHHLQKGRAVDKTSTIYQYSPYIDDEGLIRMRGRIDNAPGILHETKRPILLPHESRISFLFVDYYHRKYLHKNHDTTINELRQRVVIPRVRSLLKKVRKSCQKCMNDAAKAVPPEMGQLPESRLQIHCRPFSYVGVDYFGPLEIREGRKTVKRYGALFTCMTSRGVHLEVAHSLTTDSCIMALERFMSRRGMPIEIISDNATNFRGASKELAEMVQNISPSQVARTFPEVNWKFIPPSSPHFGGTWERLVRTVKSNLLEICQVKHPTDEMLSTFFTQVENIVNTRPLTDVPVEDESAEALTPNHLIHGTSSGVKPFFNKDLSDGLYTRKWITVEQMLNTFWRRFVVEVVPNLTKRSKWFVPAKPLTIGDVVIIIDERSPRNHWQKGIIVNVNHAKDGQTRSAVVKTQTGIYTKPTIKLAVLDVKSKRSHLDASALTGGDNVANTTN